MSKIVLNYENTQKDFMAFYRWTTKRSKAQIPVFYIVLWLILTAITYPAMLEALSSVYDGGSFSFYLHTLMLSAIISYFIMLVVILVQYPFARIMMNRKIKEMYEIVGKCKIELLDNKIRDTMHEITTEVPYSKIRSVENDKRNIYVYYGGASAFIIPFSAFKNEKEKQQLLDFLHQKLRNQKTYKAEQKRAEQYKNKLKKRKIIRNIALIIIIPLSLYFFVMSSPFSGVWYIQDYVVTDPSYVDDAEQINATRSSTTNEEKIYVHLKIKTENAERMIENDVLKECVDSEIKYDGSVSYECSDPIWKSSRDAGAEYPTDDRDALCTRSWLNHSSVDAQTRSYYKDDESSSVLCVNPVIGELWYSYYARTPIGWQ